MGVARAGLHRNEKWEGREPPQERHLNEMTSGWGIGWESPRSFGNFVLKSRNQRLSTMVMPGHSLKEAMAVKSIKSNRMQSLREKMTWWGINVRCCCRWRPAQTTFLGRYEDLLLTKTVPLCRELPWGEQKPGCPEAPMTAWHWRTKRHRSYLQWDNSVVCCIPELPVKAGFSLRPYSRSTPSPSLLPSLPVY